MYNNCYKILDCSYANRMSSWDAIICIYKTIILNPAVKGANCISVYKPSVADGKGQKTFNTQGRSTLALKTEIPQTHLHYSREPDLWCTNFYQLKVTSNYITSNPRMNVSPPAKIISLLSSVHAFSPTFWEAPIQIILVQLL